jgi:hypothetical protein
LELLIESDLVIADLSDRNPNVMYELGVRHSTGKPVVLMTSDTERIPFDVAGIRVLVYGITSPTKVLQLSDQLRAYVVAMESSPASDSPVLDAQAYKRYLSDEQRATEVQVAPQESVLKTIVERLI